MAREGVRGTSCHPHLLFSKQGADARPSPSMTWWNEHGSNQRHSVSEGTLTWRHIQAGDDAFEFGARWRIKRHHQRIMPRNNVVPSRCLAPHEIESLNGITCMEARREGPPTIHVLEIVQNIGSQNDPAALGIDPKKLQPARMSAREVQGNARRQ